MFPMMLSVCCGKEPLDEGERRTSLWLQGRVCGVHLEIILSQESGGSWLSPTFHDLISHEAPGEAGEVARRLRVLPALSES